MPAVMVTGPSGKHDSKFFPSGGLNHSQCSFLPEDYFTMIVQACCN